MHYIISKEHRIRAWPQEQCMTAAGESRVWTEFFLSPAMAREPATVCVQQDRLVSDPLHDAWYYRHLPVY